MGLVSHTFGSPGMNCPSEPFAFLWGRGAAGPFRASTLGRTLVTCKGGCAGRFWTGGVRGLRPPRSSCCGGPAWGTGTAWPHECTWRGSWGLTRSQWRWGGRGSASLVLRAPVHPCFRPACLGRRCAGPTCSLCSLLPGGHSSASRAPGAQAGRGSRLGPAPGASVHPPCGTVTVLTPELRRACGQRAPTPAPCK